MIRSALALLLAAAPVPGQSDRVPVMPDAAFWSIVDASRAASADPAEQAEWLRAALELLDPETLVAFQNAFDHQVNLGFSYDVWDVGAAIHGSMTEEGFRAFRCWLVAQGSAVYRAALDAPATLAQRLPADTRGPVGQEKLCYVGAEVWAAKTGHTIDDIPIAESAPTALAGLPFADGEDDDAARHFPELRQRFATKPLD